MKISDVIKPSRIRALPIDARGYPIFYVALIDETGKPFFTHNDQNKSIECFKKDLCSICGQKLLRRRWLVGGPMSIFDDRGIFVDGPVHGECGRYALQVCPWLAAPAYGRTIAMQMKPKFEKIGMAIGVDNTRIPGRPTVFCYGLTEHVIGEFKQGSMYYYPKRPWLRVEYWAHGRQLGEAEAQPLMDEWMTAERVATYDDAFKAVPL